MGIELHSEYEPTWEKPHAVSVWERRAAGAESFEEAHVQLAYQQLVETRKLRMVATGILALLLVGTVFWLIVFLTFVES